LETMTPKKSLNYPLSHDIWFNFNMPIAQVSHLSVLVHYLLPQ
jgi:hypothetical protein